MKRSFLSFSAALALAIFVNSSAYGVLITERFDTDPTLRGWSGVGNDPLPGPGQGVPPEPDYGFRTSDNTGTSVLPPWSATASAGGEIGGDINRGPNSFYGVDLGGPHNFATTDMSVKGVIFLQARGGSTTLNLGWSQGITSVIGVGGGVSSALHMSWDDGNNGANGMRGRNAGGGTIVSGDGPSFPDPRSVTPVPHPFNMIWDVAGDGSGVFTMELVGVGSNTLAFSAAEVAQLPLLTHWGMWGRTGATPDNPNTLWLDDIEYTGNQLVIPEPSTLLLVICSALGLVATRRVR